MNFDEHDELHELFNLDTDINLDTNNVEFMDYRSEKENTDSGLCISSETPPNQHLHENYVHINGSEKNTIPSELANEQEHQQENFTSESTPNIAESAQTIPDENNNDGNNNQKENTQDQDTKQPK